jgi:hypothetical protein
MIAITGATGAKGDTGINIIDGQLNYWSEGRYWNKWC